MIKYFKYIRFFLVLFLISQFVYATDTDIDIKLNKDEMIYVINNYINKADLLNRKSEKRVKYFEQSAELAKDLIKNYPKDDRGYAYYAYSYGSILKEIPFYKKISVTKDVTKFAKKAVDINENNHLALFVLGMIYREASQIDGIQKKLAEKYFDDVIDSASLQKAVSCFEKAIHLDPNNLQYRYELAKTYQDFGLNKKALSEYKEIAIMETISKKDKIFKNKALKQLRKLVSL